MRVFITGTGIISPLGNGKALTAEAVKSGVSGITPLTLFKTPSAPLPVGEISFTHDDSVPRTHSLALAAALQATAGLEGPLDAVVIGTTTGGMAVSEELIRRADFNPARYLLHSAGSVSEYVAGRLNCRGPVITVCTACSSGSVAVKIALELLRSGKGRTVLAGGADCLCRLTYHGFNSLQLIDPEGARPFDINRKGMSVAEAAAMVVLSAADGTPRGAACELLEVGLSCDAYHPSAPHPEGRGAFEAMQSALAGAGVSPQQIDFVHLHGTGTIDNDLSEAKALKKIFPAGAPSVSSTKGAFGHSLAASGVAGLIVTSMAMEEGFVPATRCAAPDPKLEIVPENRVIHKKVRAALTNSFGFGGNNASILSADLSAGISGLPQTKHPARPYPSAFSVIAASCSTGAGNKAKTMESIYAGKPCAGTRDIAEMSAGIPPPAARRLKRLARMTLGLAIDAVNDALRGERPGSVYFGTAWGAMSETYGFLSGLFKSQERFASPTDFIGSVHNAPAGHVASWFQATGPNITVSGGDCSFEQALYTAGLIAGDGDTLLVIGADEHHEPLSGAFDRSIGPWPADGGGALLLRKSGTVPAFPRIRVPFLRFCPENAKGDIPGLIAALGGVDVIRELFGAVLASVPACSRETGRGVVSAFMGASGLAVPVIDLREIFGQFATASAPAVAAATEFVARGELPPMGGDGLKQLHGRGILVIGTGNYLSAVEVLPPGGA